MDEEDTRSHHHDQSAAVDDDDLSAVIDDNYQPQVFDISSDEDNISVMELEVVTKTSPKDLKTSPANSQNVASLKATDGCSRELFMKSPSPDSKDSGSSQHSSFSKRNASSAQTYASSSQSGQSSQPSEHSWSITESTHSKSPTVTSPKPSPEVKSPTPESLLPETVDLLNYVVEEEPESRTVHTPIVELTAIPCSSQDSRIQKQPVVQQSLKKWRIPYIPDFVREQETFNRSISCRGCKKIFLCQVFMQYSIPQIDYFNHCYSCPEYLKLGRKTQCEDCASVFLTKQLYDLHKASDTQGCLITAERNRLQYGVKTIIDSEPFYLKLPEEVPSETPVSTACSSSSETSETTPSKSSPKKTPSTSPKKRTTLIWRFYKPDYNFSVNAKKAILDCEGCGQGFECVEDKGRFYAGKDFHYHCIFKCKEYKKKVRIGFCFKCMRIFLNKRDKKEHREKCVRYLPDNAVQVPG